MVEEHSMSIRPMPAAHIREPLNPHGMVVERKVVAKVEVPKESWKSQQHTEFVVAPLKEHNAILGMPFLAAEGVLIDPIRDRVVLPQLQPADDCKLKERKEVEKAGKSDVSAADDDSCKMEDVNVVPSICLKVRTCGIPTPPLDLIWIKAFEDFNKS